MHNEESIPYEAALRDLMANRRRRRVTSVLARLDPRPTSPRQVALIGAALAGVGWLVPGVHLALVVGLTLLGVAFVTALMRPQSRRVYWRGRPIDLPAEETGATHLYRLLYRTS